MQSPETATNSPLRWAVWMLQVGTTSCHMAYTLSMELVEKTLHLSYAELGIPTFSGNRLVMATGTNAHPSATGGKAGVAEADWRGGVPPEQWRGAPGRKEVAALLGREIEGCVLVGHGLAKDLKALQLRHPKCDAQCAAAICRLLEHAAAALAWQRVGIARMELTRHAHAACVMYKQEMEQFPKAT